MACKKPNNYIIEGDIVKIELRRRNKESLWTLIDIDDLERVINFPYSWHSYHNIENDEDYAVTTLYDEELRKKYGCVILRLHVFIKEDETEHGKHVDHENHNTLDNRKENLRVSNHDDNNRNRKGKNSNNKSGYRNVCWNKKFSMWSVQLQIDGTNKILGYFDDVDEAGLYAKKMRYIYYGEYAGES